MALMFQKIGVRNLLDEPEFYSPGETAVADSREIVYTSEPKPNPNYLSDGSPERIVCEFLNDFIPDGQSIQIMGSVNEMTRFCVYDLVWILMLSGVCLLIFRRVDLK